MIYDEMLTLLNDLEEMFGMTYDGDDESEQMHPLHAEVLEMRDKIKALAAINLQQRIDTTKDGL